MTVIKPNKKNTIIRLVTGFGVVIVILLILNIAVYSQTVDMEHEISETEESISELRAENVDLKNDFHSVVAYENLTKLAEERGLIKDENPTWVFASQF